MPINQNPHATYYVYSRKKSIKYLYNYFSGTWIKVTSHANLGWYRVWRVQARGGGRARAGTPTLPGCDSATLEQNVRAARPSIHPAAPSPPQNPWYHRRTPTLTPRSLSPGRPRSVPRAKFNIYLQIIASARVTNTEVSIITFQFAVTIISRKAFK